MKRILYTMIAGLLLLSWRGIPESTVYVIGKGDQPQVSRDNKGSIRLVYGHKDSIFCAVSTDQGSTFSKPVLVAQVTGMHLGMSRGPQIASSANYSIITAMDKSGNIRWFRCSHSSNAWKDMGFINDVKGSSPEGLMSIAADRADNFYAVWLDIRTGKQNQIYFSSISGNATGWSSNKMVYQSPDGHVCECCKPSISAEGPEIAIMFRNWINGSRDLYLLQSSNKGKSFKSAEKLGAGTWKLNGCPMDGGGVTIDPAGAVHTVWQREGTIYYCQPGVTETMLEKGRTCSITGSAGSTIITLEKKDTLEAIKLPQKEIIPIGTGSSVKPLMLPGNKMLFVWEQDGLIKYKRA
ncbi:MAG TPA: hypothetical protein VHE34_16665 [Puia sp.]|uniref:hypothetical protein n=1 Tax=Puia sp. TaxID=2045100 RepID=UPI002BD07819|nr:hypothetical protein [Puia sp.]HVU96865.1 hypothetical protein [Puia sp.]